MSLVLYPVMPPVALKMDLRWHKHPQQMEIGGQNCTFLNWSSLVLKKTSLQRLQHRPRKITRLRAESSRSVVEFGDFHSLIFLFRFTKWVQSMAKWSKLTKQLVRCALLAMPLLLRGDVLVTPLIRLPGNTASTEVAHVLNLGAWALLWLRKLFGS